MAFWEETVTPSSGGNESRGMAFWEETVTPSSGGKVNKEGRKDSIVPSVGYFNTISLDCFTYLTMPKVDL